MYLAQDPRELTFEEQRIWNYLRSGYKRLEKTVTGIIYTFEVGATFQSWITQHNIPITLFDASDQATLDDILNRYNIIGRVMSGAETGKYNVEFERGDLIIGAPPGMPREQYANDVYPDSENAEGLEGVLLIVGVVAVGLVVLAYATVKTLDFYATRKDQEFRNKILDTDKEMSKQPKETRDAWTQMKKQSADLIEKTNNAHGSSNWLGSLGLGSAAGIVVLIIGLIIVSKISKR